MARMTTDELIARARKVSRNAEWGMSRTEWTSAIWVLERLADALEDEAAGRGLAERKLQRAMEVLEKLDLDAMVTLSHEVQEIAATAIAEIEGMQ